MNDVHFSSKTDEWATPIGLFQELDKEFHFTLDPCANDENHKCDKYYTKSENGLEHDLGGGNRFSAIHLTGVQAPLRGFASAQKKRKSRTPSLSCSSLLAPIRLPFMSSYTVRQRFVLSRVA